MDTGVKIPATVGILTYNSAKTLERALQSVTRFDDILICDGGSTDGTLEIAQRYGARIIPQNQDKPGPLHDFSVVRNYCLQNAAYDWFLYIDSDEMAEPALIEEIASIVAKNPEVDGYQISPRIIFQGKRVEYSSNYPAYQFRFFKRKPGTRFERPIHERIVFPAGAKIGRLGGHWNYFVSGPEDIYNDLKRDLPKFAKRYEGKPFYWKLLAIKNVVRTLFSIFVKSGWNHLLHHGEAYPIHMEWLRMKYQIYVLVAVFGFYHPT